MRFQTRLLRVVLPLLAVSVLGSITAMGLYSRDAMLDQAGRDGQLLASVIGRSIEVSQKVEWGSENIVSMDMVASAKIISQFVAVAEQCALPINDIRDRLKTMVSDDGLSEILVTDAKGKAYLDTSREGAFQFLPDPQVQPQASEFYRLLSGKTSQSVVQGVIPREIDGRPYKYVGVSGVDHPRIVQVGLDGSMLDVLNQSIGVQQLLDHMVNESVIFRIWVVDIGGRVLQFADDEGDMSHRALSDQDFMMLGDVINQATAKSRLDGNHISVAAPLMTSGHLDDGTPDSGQSSRMTDSVRGAILIHMSTGALEELLYRQLGIAGLTSVLSLVLGFLILTSFTRRVLAPVGEAVDAAEQVAAGDLSVQLKGRGTDEIGKLNSALARMVSHLNSLIGEVQHSTGHLAHTVVQLSEMSRNQSEGATRLSLATNEIAAATQQISATSDELLNTMTSVTLVTNETSQLANEGQESLGRMEAVMRDLVEASASVSRRLGMIAERTEIIASVTTTITKIADQTNLLSLNASMEAEKAGEYGVGFAVLSREIRRLADQTALATLDIEQMVQEMKHAVSGGVSEMHRFAEKVDRSVKDTQESNGRFSEILGRVRFMLPRFAEIHESMRSQSSGAHQIRDAMEGLKETAQSTQASVKAMGDATQQLEGAIDSLKKEVSIFRVRSPETKSGLEE